MSGSSKSRAAPLFSTLSGLSSATIGRDLLAGLTLAAVAVPEQMATARLGGFSPTLGFIAFATATLAFAAFGADRRLSVGADSTITPIFAGALAAAGGASAHSAALLAVMTGLLLVAGGVLRLGWIADLLSQPVIAGFLAGVAVHIVVSQAPAVMGVAAVTGETPERIVALLREAPGARPAPLVLGGLTLLAILALESRLPRAPAALIAVLAASVATPVLGLEREGVALLGAGFGGRPALGLPMFDLDEVGGLLSLAVVIALVVMVQTAATARAFAVGADADTTPRDFLGVGAANIAAGLFGAFPVNASPPRTAIVVESGGSSQLAGLSAGAVVLAAAYVGGPLLSRIPLPALGAVLLFVAIRIFRVGTFADLLRRTRAEFALAALTLALIVILPIQTGVGLGVLLSLVHGVFTTTRVRPIRFERVPGTTVWWPAPDASGGGQERVTVIGFQAPLSFLNAEAFRSGCLAEIAAAERRGRILVLEASSLVEVDYTGAKALIDVISAARKVGLDFAVARLESVRAQSAFERFGVTAALGPGRVFRSVDEAVRTLCEPAEAAPPA